MSETLTAPADSIEAAALARLHNYLRRAQPVDDHDAEIARDAFVQAFRWGAAWGIRTTSQLSSPQFREAISVLAAVVGESAS